MRRNTLGTNLPTKFGSNLSPPRVIVLPRFRTERITSESTTGSAGKNAKPSGSAFIKRGPGLRHGECRDAERCATSDRILRVRLTMKPFIYLFIPLSLLLLGLGYWGLAVSFPAHSP